MKNFKKNHGLTLIETLFALSIASVVLLAIFQLIIDANINQRIKITAKNITQINSAVMKRITHDGVDFDLWENQVNNVNPTTIVADDYILWQGTENFADSFLSDYLTPDNACDPTGSWIPRESDPADTIRNTPLINCSLWRNIEPLGLTFNGFLKKEDSATSQGMVGFRMYIDFQNSDLFTGLIGNSNTNTDFSKILTLVDYIESNFANDLIGSQSVYFATVDDLTDYTSASVTTRTVDECLIGGLNCLIVVELNLSGTTNQQYLRTDGSNAMLAPIRFAQSGQEVNDGEFQKCAYWELDTTTGTWDSTTVECGLKAGIDRVSGNPIDRPESVMTETFTDNLYITYRDIGAAHNDDPVDIEVTNKCKLYTEDDGYLDLASLDVETPCGIISASGGTASAIVQFIGNNVQAATVYSENIITGTINANELYLRSTSATDANLIRVEDPAGSTLFHMRYDAGVLYYDLEGDILNINNFQNVNITADVTTIDGNLIQTGSSQFNLNGTQMQINDGQSLTLRGNQSRATMGFDAFYGSVLPDDSSYFGISIDTNSLVNLGDNAAVRATNLEVQSDRLNLRANTEINIDGTTILRDGSNIYSQYSDFKDLGLTDVDFNALPQSQKDLLKLATLDYVKHLDNMKSNIVLRYVNTVQAGNGILPKPNCLDFTETDDLYLNTAARTDSLGGVGYDLARIVLVPITFKTYSEAFGQNQAYTHHAQSNVNNWTIYQYLSGEGELGEGAREDGAGTSLAMVYCDYTGYETRFRQP